MKKIFLFCAFACVGITAEIFFTALSDLISMMEKGEVNWKLQGKSYIWMFPIYGLAGIFFPIALKFIGKYHILIRAAIWASGILVVEFIMGALLEFFTGQCPWEYTTGWHVMGYIRLDYFPFWAAFGIMIEKILAVLNRMDFD